MSESAVSARIGVTGAGGYIGSRLVSELDANGHDIVAIDNFYDAKVETIDGHTIHDVDVRDREELRKIFTDVDAIAHLAALTGVQECEEHPETAFDVNVGGTENVAWLCRKWELPLVFPCSMAIIGDPVEFPITANHPRNPLNQYGLTKTMSEQDIQMLAKDRFPAHIFMKSNLYGHHEIDGTRIGKQTVINIFVEKALNQEPLTVHKPGTQSRDFIHVKDVAHGYVRSIESLLDTSTTSAETFPLASGDCRSIREIAELVQTLTAETQGYEPEIKLVENPREAETDAKDFTVDTSAANEQIGFTTNHTVEGTIREMLNETVTP